MASLANKVAALTLTTLLSTGALADDKGTPIEAGGDVNLTIQTRNTLQAETLRSIPRLQTM
jgi:ApbE superfamily uncharacterized protein (UPF0280 family)